jgi:hypothetical protein
MLKCPLGRATPPLEAVLVERNPLTFRSGPSWVFSFYAREVNAKVDQPFAGFSDMMTQSFEQARKAMEKYADLFEKSIKGSPLLDADLNKKTEGLQ